MTEIAPVEVQVGHVLSDDEKHALFIASEEWQSECKKYRGRVLTGKKAHYCFDWDFLPVDETTPDEMDCCTCFKNEG